MLDAYLDRNGRRNDNVDSVFAKSKAEWVLEAFVRQGVERKASVSQARFPVPKARQLSLQRTSARINPSKRRDGRHRIPRW